MRAAAAFLLGCVLAATAARSEEAGPGAAASMRVAMLAERVAKLQLQVGQGLLAERSRRTLPEALRDLEGSVRALRGAPAGAEMHDNFVMLGILAGEYKAWALRPATRDSARRLAERAEEITWVASKSARLAQERSRTPSGSLALAAIEAATLAQRVARLQLARQWGLREQAAAIEGASRELRAKLDLLAASSPPGSAAEVEVQASLGQHAFLVQGIADPAPDARRLEFTAKSGDNILESMERAARLYEAAP